MKIFIRTDSSTIIGSGHLMRCLTLAEELKRRGTDVVFISREHPGHMIALIEDKGYPVVRLPFCASKICCSEPQDPVHAAWLGAPWRVDADETLSAIGGSEPNWLIVDHYAIDYRWERALRPHVGRIIVIDDLADRCHDCDLLLDQNLYGDMESRYANLVPETCQKLLGPSHALLRDEFKEARRYLHRRDGCVKRILIFIGGSDPHNVTKKALQAVRKLNRPDIANDVVVGASNPHRVEIENLCSLMSNTIFHFQVGNMAELMLKADLAIGAGGSATWERCFLGLPSITLVIAENQSETTLAVAAAGATWYLGRGEDITVSAIESAIRETITDASALMDMSTRAMVLMDGGSCSRGSVLIKAILGGENAEA